jgi:hypothetical protein
MPGISRWGRSKARASAPDSASIPRGKRILGADGYWQEFRRAVLGQPSDLWQPLMEKPGNTPVDMEV